MIEILWHGRGGQGAFTAAKLLGAAFILHSDDNYSIAFPSFGPERRGAPIRAFTKLSNKSIGNRSEIEKADFSIYLDDTLFSDRSLLELKPNGKILLNTKRHFEDERIITIDANTLAIEILKRPITNTIMLGAFSAVFEEILLKDIQSAIEQYMPSKLHENNIAAVKAAAGILTKGEVS
ncbi:2-oxoacid:acceptor oxidoreductase family protein [Anaerosporobacter sp.]